MVAVVKAAANLSKLFTVMGVERVYSRGYSGYSSGISQSKTHGLEQRVWHLSAQQTDFYKPVCNGTDGLLGHDRAV